MTERPPSRAGSESSNKLVSRNEWPVPGPTLDATTVGHRQAVTKPPTAKLAPSNDPLDGQASSLRHNFSHIYHSSSGSRPPSTRTSSSSLQALNEDTVVDVRSEPNLAVVGRTSTSSKMSSMSHQLWQPTVDTQALPRRFEHPHSVDYPVYPDQSYAVLQSQVHPTYYPSFVRSRSSYPSHTDSAVTPTTPAARVSRTAGNTPLSSPGLFSVRSPRTTPPLASDDIERIGSPFLHPTHLQPPKETHTAEVDRDLVTGNKLINQYEILEELGRGEHGKVKLGRHVATRQQVAIKIVQRYSKRRRLGKLGNPEDKVKKEVAILKKARHPNVVSLLEVIDDPNRQKVYIVLEYVENGEIVWRKKGLREVVQMDKRRLDREKAGIEDSPLFLEESQQYIRNAQRMRHQRDRARERRQAQAAATQQQGIHAWSLEHGGESDDELGPELSIARTSSRSMLSPDDHHSSPSHSFVSTTSDIDRRTSDALAAIEGSMYGPYVDFSAERRFSTASSSMGYAPSEPEWISDDDDMSHVPCLTINEARNAFRDSVLGLEYLHYQGIIHRDIKPANLLVTANHRVKISDFGVSYLGRPLRDEEEEQVGERDATELDDARELSKTVGTPAFYAPELCYTGDDFVDTLGSIPKITGAIDVWSLGVTLYGMIFGRLPFVSDDEYSMFQTIVKQDVFIPRKRLKPVEENPSCTTSQWPRGISSSSEKRMDDELAYEEIDDELFDLLKRLLTKDPVKRITLKEIKHHPWVLYGLPNPRAWIEESDPGYQSKGKKIEVSTEEVTTAVSKVPFIQRVRSNVARLSNYLTGRSRDKDKDSRKRAPSAANSIDSCHSSASSNNTFSGKHSWEGPPRRASLRGDEELFLRLSSRIAASTAAKDGEHPLAKSVTASPVERDGQTSYFQPPPPLLPDSSNKATAVETVPPTSNSHAPDHRPDPLERTTSTLSTAESTKTVRPLDMDPTLHRVSTPVLLDAVGASHVGAIFGGASRRLTRSLHAADWRSERSPSFDATSSLDGSDGHSEPSLALSVASAVGQVQHSGFIRDEDHHSCSPRLADKSSADSLLLAKESLLRQRSMPPSEPCSGPKPERESSSPDEAREVSPKTMTPTPTAAADAAASAMDNLSVCEPPCAGGLTTSPPSAATISSSSVDDYTSGMSQSASHPSIPSVISGASSLSGDGLHVYTKDPEPDLPEPSREIPSILRTGETVKAQHVVTSPRAPHEDDEARYDCDDEDDSEDEGIVMGKKKPAHSRQASSS
ncbi:hypothetical protein ASPZODRAFT_150987 [Penicilliopsis zonata CBS 506.65]|uniref:non-specific serine/threonine protein kinase n=1 Tax=Penicilliopsis zonata CBS 506.65 TaxID=1073090 RepID=A0A1L9SK70_9EURO|nr:hypothetical protein ASPZODRAFT_150987 [Penicilliopsis zonata CBS 506.65]OJJ47491.1 hypothetical protein ASPZODRAFT_150987 [Penicilliopsis zonata CBS 506.65]